MSESDIETMQAEHAEAMALVHSEEQQAIAATAEAKQYSPLTPQQARVEAVANLLGKAYERAGQVPIEPEEAVNLAAPFADEDFLRGAGGKEDLIYIQHASLRGRLNAVLGVGQWSLVTRNKWAEEFDYWDKVAKKNEKASRVYVEAVLIIRGALAGEAIGDMVYYPRNQTTNYGDAVEGAKSAALRRAAKDLGVGLQAWDRHWSEAWKQRNPIGGVRNQSPRPTPTPPPTVPTPTVVDVPPETPEDRRQRWIKACIEAAGGATQYVEELYEEMGADVPFSIQEIDARYVPKTKKEATDILAQIKAHRERSIAAATMKKPKEEKAEARKKDEKHASGYVRWLEENPTPKGNPRYTILIAKSNEKGVKSEGDVFVNTFDKKAYEFATAHKHQKVECRYTEGQYGAELVDGTLIESEVTP